MAARVFPHASRRVRRSHLGTRGTSDQGWAGFKLRGEIAIKEQGEIVVSLFLNVVLWPFLDLRESPSVSFVEDGVSFCDL